tara:strand:- start:243 stop:461 length:219 start_codon:yes stop_codon:yes gene_type:complete
MNVELKTINYDNLNNEDYTKILNAITWYLDSNIRSKWVDEFVKVDNIALLKAIKSVTDNIIKDKQGDNNADR